METKFELDLLDTSSEIGEHFSSEKENDKQKYLELLDYADKVGVSRERVDEVMSSVTGKELEIEAGNACEAIYESDGAEAFNKCRQDYIANAKKDKKTNFWDSLFQSVQNVADTAQTYVPQQNQNTGGKGGKNQGQSNTYLPSPPQEVRILGMKPLVFTLVALTTVIVGGIAIAKIASSKK